MIQVYSLVTQTPPNLIQILINTWFQKVDLIKLKKKKTHYIHFKTRNSPSIDIKIDLKNKLIPIAQFTKFLGLTIESTLLWRIHLNHLTNKLSTACYVIRYVKPLMSHFHSLFHTVMSYGIII